MGARDNLVAAVKDPVAFSERLLGIDLWDTQKEILRSVAANPRTAVKACHASSKTFTAAQAALWWVTRYPDGIVLTTAPTQTQVEKLLWNEIHRALPQARSKGLSYPKANQAELRIGPSCYILGLSTDEGLRFQGFHGRVLVILDEAPGIRPDIYDAIEGIRAGGDVHVLAIGNPTAVGGPFYDAFHRSRESWHTVTISAFDTPNLYGYTIPGVRGAPEDGRSLLQLSEVELNVAPRPYLVTRRWVKEKYLEWGPTSPLWQSRVMGEFPAEGHDTLIPLALIEAAQARVLRAGSPVELGVDVGWFGDDASVIALRRGPVVEILDVAHKTDTMATAARVAHALRRHADITYARVDSVGVGAGVVDRLRGDNLPVVGLNAGWSARDGERFANARAEWYWGLRERFEAGDIALPRDDELAAQLASLRWRPDARGRVTIESKDDMRRRGLSSPDKADAVMMAYAPWGSGTTGFRVWPDPETEDFYRSLDSEFFPPSHRHLRDANLNDIGF